MSMQYYIYILYSPGSCKTYTGFTNDVERRLLEHNVTEVKGFTLRYRPWLLIYNETFDSKSDAMKREKYLKSGVGREFVKQIVIQYLSTR